MALVSGLTPAVIVSHQENEVGVIVRIDRQDDDEERQEDPMFHFLAWRVMRVIDSRNPSIHQPESASEDFERSK